MEWLSCAHLVNTIGNKKKEESLHVLNANKNVIQEILIDWRMTQEIIFRFPVVTKNVQTKINK